jgi:16S rRNA processing protein RimM
VDVDWDAMILVGRIARPHGIRGQVVVNPETDFVEERYAAGATFWTRSCRGEEQLTIASARVQNGRPVIGFEGCATVEDAERLAGLELRVPEETLTPLDAGTYYHHQLVGCEVATTDGQRVGEVARVDGGSAGSLLVVNGTRGEILIPLAADICVDIDVARRQIRIEPPEGLLELNETRRSGPSEGGPGEGPPFGRLNR